MSLLTLLQTQGTPPEPQAVSGTLTMASTLAFAVVTPAAMTGTLTASGSLSSMVMKSFAALAGTLTLEGALTTALRITQAVTGTLTMAAAVVAEYIPPSVADLLTTLFRRNQTD